MDNITKTTHPLILAAAASVTIASLAAAAHFAGLIPNHGSDAPAAAAAVPAPAAAESVPAPVAKAEETSRPAAKPHPQRRQHEAAQPSRQGETEMVRQPRRTDEDWRYQSGTHRVSTNNAGIDVIPSSASPAPAVTPPVCHDCGTVESVREVAAQGEGSGLGAIAGGVLGGILGHQVGRGSGKDLATIAGAVGGAVAGHQVEKNVRTDKQFQVAVRFDDGAVRTYTQGNANWHNGDRVRLANGNLVPITPDDR